MNVNGLVKIKDDRVVLTSKDLAALFGKAHKNVIRAIETEIGYIKESASNQAGLKFEPSEMPFKKTTYTDSSGKKNKMYEMTAEGYMAVAMGFDGRESSRLRWHLLNEFRRLQSQLDELLAMRAKDERIYSRLTMLPSYHTTQADIKRLTEYAVKEFGLLEREVNPSFYQMHGHAINDALHIDKGHRPEASKTNNQHIQNICRDASNIIRDGMDRHEHPVQIMKDACAAVYYYAKRFVDHDFAERERRALAARRERTRRRQLERQEHKLLRTSDYDFEEDD